MAGAAGLEPANTGVKVRCLMVDSGCVSACQMNNIIKKFFVPAASGLQVPVCPHYMGGAFFRVGFLHCRNAHGYGTVCVSTSRRHGKRPSQLKKFFCLKSLRPLILSGFLCYPKAIVPVILLYILLYFFISFLTVPNNKASGVPKAFQEKIMKRLNFYLTFHVLCDIL